MSPRPQSQLGPEPKASIKGIHFAIQTSKQTNKQQKTDSRLELSEPHVPNAAGPSWTTYLSSQPDSYLFSTTAFYDRFL